MHDMLKLITEKAINRDSKNTLKVPQSELVFFVSQLSVMLSSGVVLSDAIEAVAAQSKVGPLQEVLYDISDRIQNGESLSVALASFPKVFSPMFISIIEASEASGQMPEMLEVLHKYLEGEMETRKQIKSALAYPCIMMVIAFLATATLMFFVLPKFTTIYESRGQSLPKITQMLLNCSKIATDLGSALIVLSVLAVAGGGIFYALTRPWGREFVDYLKIRTPVLGTMFVDAIMTRSTRIMATMLNTGVNLLDTLEVVKSSSENRFFNRFWAETCSRIEAGFQLSEAMKFASHSEFVAPAIIQMIHAGEKGGNLDSVCDKVSVFYEKKLRNSVKTVTSMIEPVMIVVMGCIIGTIAIALLLPIFRISSVVGH